MFEFLAMQIKKAKKVYYERKTAKADKIHFVSLEF